MTSEIIILEKQTGDTLTINNNFKDLKQCIEHLETIKKSKNIIIKEIILKNNKKKLVYYLNNTK